MGGPYDYRWQQARERFLRANPLCVMCERRGRVVPATVVDHITPHKGDMDLFWSDSNWQSLCDACHSGAKQAQERGGALPGCDVSGMPLDPSHPWNARK